MSTHDVIIVGAGAGGGIAAGVLAEAGKSVLLIERGRELAFDDVPRDHLRNHRYSRYGHNTGPSLDGNPRVVVDRDGQVRTVRPHEDDYQNNATGVGGGGRVYGAQAWRYLPTDFEMASTYGVPAGSSLADWPIGYAEVAPYYERAEWEIGVCGDSAGSAERWPRDKGYPMPPVPLNSQGAVMRRGAEALGWPTVAVPLLVNSAPYGGRPACINCQHCIGFVCPVDAKNDSQNTLLARGLTTGRVVVVTQAMVERIDTDGGRVVGVTYVDDHDQRHSPRAEAVVIAAGAIETARLLLHSRSSEHPDGIGNAHDQVGRHLQGHYYPGAVGLMSEQVYDGIGPGVTTAVTEFNHGNADVIGGGMIADEFVALPIIFWARNLPPDLPRWGAEAKRFMRDNYTRVTRVMGPVQEIPSPDARVTLDPTVRDRWGIPVARLSGATHPETVRTAEFMQARVRQWLEASGAQRTWGSTPRLKLSGGQHQAGTCRMGDDPAHSVTDRWGRVHGHDNLYIADGSVHVTNGGFNPVLTIMALAFRTAEHAAREW